MNTTSFEQDIKYGNLGEDIFKKNFLEFLNIKYENVTGCQQFQIIDTDFIAKIGLYEVKLNYKDNKQLIIEEYTNINESLAPISKGWFYKTKADLIVFVSKATKIMILLPFTNDFKFHYECISEDFELKRNKISVHNGREWQSAFRIIPFKNLEGYISVYKKLEINNG